MWGQARRRHRGQVVQAVWWSSVARAAGNLGSVSAPRREGEGGGRLGHAMGRWVGANGLRKESLAGVVLVKEKRREGGKPRKKKRPNRLGEKGNSFYFQNFLYIANYSEFKSNFKFGRL
jgi:hypothetical protein